MFLHSVYFWLKPELTQEHKDEFWKRIHAMADIPSVKFFFAGTPADTDRPIIDRSYSCKLVVGFDDVAGHDVYQEHPIHDDFRVLADFWSKIVIYDAVS